MLLFFSCIGRLHRWSIRIFRNCVCYICFCDAQVTAPAAKQNTKPEVDRLVSMSLAKSESEKPDKQKSLSHACYKIPTSIDAISYFKTLLKACQWLLSCLFKNRLTTFKENARSGPSTWLKPLAHSLALNRTAFPFSSRRILKTHF